MKHDAAIQFQEINLPLGEQAWLIEDSEANDLQWPVCRISDFGGLQFNILAAEHKIWGWLMRLEFTTIWGYGEAICYAAYRSSGM